MLAELIKIHTSDGLTHYGAYYTPPAGKAKPLGVVLVHGFTGHFVGEVESALPLFLVQAGYTCLVVNNRGHGFAGAATEKFTGCLPDIQAAMDFIEERGYSYIALLGHSKGGVKVAYYLAQRRDTRVKAIGLLSPSSTPHHLRFRPEMNRGPKKRQAFLAKIEKLVAEGKGDTILTMPYWPYYSSAAMLWDHVNMTGDDTLENIRGAKLPILAICGEKETDWCIPVMALHKNPPMGVTTVIVPGADHVYTGVEADLARIVIGWLNTIQI